MSSGPRHSLCSRWARPHRRRVLNKRPPRDGAGVRGPARPAHQL